MGRELIRTKKAHEPGPWDQSIEEAGAWSRKGEEAVAWGRNGGGIDLWDQKIEGFMESQVKGRGLDERTAKAYRLDLEHLYRWLQERGTETLNEDLAERYLRYLLQEKKLRASTVTRKYRVFKGYLAYLSRQGFLDPHRELTLPTLPILSEDREREARRTWEEKAERIEGQEWKGQIEQQKQQKQPERIERGLTRAEVDSFFIALDREYEGLDSDFRKRVCLRDHVMMGLLFYHGLDISEILRLELRDYDRSTGVLSVCRKQDQRKISHRDKSCDSKDKSCDSKDKGRDSRGKGRGSREQAERILIFSKKLREQLELWIREHGYFEQVSEYREVLFLSKLGKPLSMKMVINIFEKYRILAGIEKVCTPKDLKKSMERYARELVMERYG